MRAPSEVNLAPQTTSMKTYKRVYCFFVICLSFLNFSNCGGKKSFSEIIEGRNQGVYNREQGPGKMTETSLIAGGREGWLLPRKKREESIKKCPDWLKQHPKEEKRRRLLLCLLIASTSSLTASALGEKPSLLPLPQLRHRVSRDAIAGRSVGGIRVNTARAFCRGGH